MMTIRIVLTAMGANTSPTFDVYIYSGGMWSVAATMVPKNQFVYPGYILSVPDDTTQVRITNHLGVCYNYEDMDVIRITTTTTTTTLP